VKGGTRGRGLVRWGKHVYGHQKGLQLIRGLRLKSAINVDRPREQLNQREEIGGEALGQNLASIPLGEEKLIFHVPR